MRTEITLHEVNDIFRSYIGRGEIINMKRLSGTTSGLVYKLESDQGQAYTLKFDEPYQIEMVGRLLETYQSSPLLPNLLYTAPDHSFFIYTFIEGTTHIPQGPKKEWLTKLVKELLNRYEPTPLEAWGRLEYPLESWRRFHEISIGQAKDNIGDILTEEDYTFIQAQVEKWFGHGMQSEEKYVLHGDTGVHNFVFDQSSLAGVIDPSPMAGPLIYDFVYAFCSSPEEINLDTLYGAYEHLEQGRVDKRKLIAEVSVQLYCRVGLSIRHHPHDLPEYLMAWDYWKGIVREEPF